MIVRCEDLKSVCSKILNALDNNSFSIITETLAIYTEGKYLYLAVTNREYFVKIKLDIQEEIEFRATVKAEVFLKLISKMTSETITFSIEDNALVIVGNGKYKLPMIYDGDELLSLPTIDINNITSEFKVPSSILHSITNYNSKELAKKAVIANPVQKMYYLDSKGCITFTSGACVNKFDLDTTVSMLLDEKLVKLFKLFSGLDIDFKYGKDSVDGTIQTKIRLTSDTVELTAIINSDETLFDVVPKDTIRNMAYEHYNNSIIIDKQAVIDALERILLFPVNTLNHYGTFVFKKDSVSISSLNQSNLENIYYSNSIDIDEDYTATLDLEELVTILSGMKTQSITVNFGNHKSFVFSENHIYNIVPECKL